MADIEVLGIQQAVNEFNKRIKKLNILNPIALREIGLDLSGKSVKRAPLDTADLRGSGFSKVEGDSVTVGFTAVYALRQHEEMNYNHPRGGEAKYLERPFRENTAKYIKHLADSTKRAVD